MWLRDLGSQNPQAAESQLSPKAGSLRPPHSACPPGCERSASWPAVPSGRTSHGKPRAATNASAAASATILGSPHAATASEAISFPVNQPIPQRIPMTGLATLPLPQQTRVGPQVWQMQRQHSSAVIGTNLNSLRLTSEAYRACGLGLMQRSLPRKVSCPSRELCIVPFTRDQSLGVLRVPKVAQGCSYTPARTQALAQPATAHHP